MKIPPLLVALVWVVFPFSGAAMAAGIQEEVYGKMPDGREVRLYTLANGRGVTAKVMNYGATLVSVQAPDRTGKVAEVTAGYDTLPEWLADRSYFGATVGRYGNRIAGAKFTLDGREHTLPPNNKTAGTVSCLHGGVNGFNKKLWAGKITGNGVEFTCVSADGEEGFPGNLSVKVAYTLDEEGALTWAATATTDAPTVVNMIHHAYWNLSGDFTRTVDGHELVIPADHYLPTTPGIVPTGGLEPVKGTPMDFTQAVRLGDRTATDFPALRHGPGYDHAYILPETRGMRQAARVKDTESGRVMTVSTDAAAVQFYIARFNGSTKGRGGIPYPARGALCLETEAYPDAPNQPAFPSTVLRPGETYRHTTVWRFSAE